MSCHTESICRLTARRIPATGLHPGIELIVCPVQVQGSESPLQIVRAIEIFNTLKQVDVIIVGRGGGSIEELWSFNDEKVVVQWKNIENATEDQVNLILK